MEVPLVQGRSQKYRVQGNTLGLARLGGASLIATNSKANIQRSGIFSDAVKITISNEAKTQQAAKELESSGSSLFQKGAGESALERLADVASQMLKLSDKIKEQNGSPQQAALEDELNSLKEQFNSITQGADFKRIIEITASIRQSLANGASNDSIARALAGETGLLGSQFISLIGAGAFSDIEKFSSSLSDISSLKFDGAFDRSIALGALSKSQSAINSLHGYNPAAPQSEETPKETPVNQGVVVPDQETQFIIGSDIALAMKSYDSKGIIASAATGYGMDPKEIFQIMIRAPKEEKDPDKEKALKGEALDSPFTE